MQGLAGQHKTWEAKELTQSDLHFWKNTESVLEEGLQGIKTARDQFTNCDNNQRYQCQETTGYTILSALRHITCLQKSSFHGLNTYFTFNF